MAVYGAAGLPGATGNGLVLWIAGFKTPKTVNAAWFLRLAAADFIFTLFLPFSIAYTALGFRRPFGRLLCKPNGAVAFLNMSAGVFLLTVISADRRLSLLRPVWAGNRRTPKAAHGAALIARAAAFALGGPHLVFRETAVSSRNVTGCSNNFALSAGYEAEASRRLWRTRHRAAVAARFLPGFVLPFGVLLACYGVVALRMKRRRLARSSRPFRIMVAVTASSFLCYFPYHIFSLLETWKTDAGPGLQTALYLGVPLASGLAFFNGCVNPVLDVFVGQRAFRRSLLSAFEGAFGEDFALSFSGKRKSRSVSRAEIQMH